VSNDTDDIWLWLDDVRDPAKCFAGTPWHDRWTWCKSIVAAQRLLLTGQVTRCSLDHDLGMVQQDEHAAVVQCCEVESPTGYDLCLWMEATGHWPLEMPQVHSANPYGASRMRSCIARNWSIDGKRKS
jgi:hypothetical protein